MVAKSIQYTICVFSIQIMRTFTVQTVKNKKIKNASVFFDFYIFYAISCFKEPTIMSLN